MLGITYKESRFVGVMKNEEMTQEEKGLTDKLEFFHSENTEIHFKLHKFMQNGNRMFLNGFIKERSNERLWLIDENKLGEVRISISEIFDVEERR